MNLYIKPLGPWQVMAVRVFAAWGKITSRSELLKAYSGQAKTLRKALIGSNLSSLVIRGHLKRFVFDDGTEWYEITPAGRELARRLENAGS